MESKSNGASAPRCSDPAPAKRSSKLPASRLLREAEDPNMESEPRADRDPKSKLREVALGRFEDPLGGGAIGADFP